MRVAGAACVLNPRRICNLASTHSQSTYAQNKMITLLLFGCLMNGMAGASERVCVCVPKFSGAAL